MGVLTARHAVARCRSTQPAPFVPSAIGGTRATSSKVAASVANATGAITPTCSKPLTAGEVTKPATPIMTIIICVQGGCLVGVYTEGKRNVRAVLVDFDNLKVSDELPGFVPVEPLSAAPDEVRDALKSDRC